MSGRKLLLPLFFLILISSIPLVYADTDVNILNFPTELAEAWGIPEFGAQLFLSTLVLMALIMPLLLLKAKGLAILLVGICAMGFLVAIAWLPYWLMLLSSLIVAGIYAGKIKRMM